MIYTGPKGSTLKTGPTASLLRSSRNFKESLELKWTKTGSIAWWGVAAVANVGPMVNDPFCIITSDQVEANQYVANGIGAGSCRLFKRKVYTWTYAYDWSTPPGPTKIIESWAHHTPNTEALEHSREVLYGNGARSLPPGYDHYESISEVLDSAPGGFSAKRTVIWYNGDDEEIARDIYEVALSEEIFIEGVIADALAIYEASTPIADCGPYGKQFTWDADSEITEGTSGITGNFGGILYPYIGTHGNIPWFDSGSISVISAVVVGGYYKVQAASWRIKKIPIDVSESPHNNAGDPEYENKAYFTGYYELEPDGELWNGIAELTP